jgi:serine/threonine protein kinase
MPPSLPVDDKYTGLTIQLAGLGQVRLERLLATGLDTHVFHTDHPGVVVKVFDLDCGKEDEVSYGPYADFELELANFDFILNHEGLRTFVPVYYGANIDYAAKYAFIAMEYLEGQNLKSWCDDARPAGLSNPWIELFRESVHEALSILQSFHHHGVILMDFKPENVMRLSNQQIKFVDLGAWLTPRFAVDLDKYVYSATPDHAEVLIDASNLQTGVAPTVATDLFSAGVALFEMATGHSRVIIDGPAASQILGDHTLCNFRDSQIKAVWHAYPHLKEALPLLEQQLNQGHLLFADLWHLLKAYVTANVADWESLTHAQQEHMLLETGTTFIRDQLPSPLAWLANPIAQATTLRSLRLKTVPELLQQVAVPACPEAIDDVLHHNCFIQYLQDLEHSVDFVQDLNAWQVKPHPVTGAWAISAVVAGTQSAADAPFVFLSESFRTSDGHRFFHVVSDLEADDMGDNKLCLGHLQDDHSAWIGAPPSR